MGSVDSLNQELEAMAVIGRALGGLSDPAARLRVLTWATERFAAMPPANVVQFPVAQTRPVVAPGSDPALAVDSLDDIFVDEPEAPAAQPADARPLDVMLRSFSADFQRFVDEWNGATA